MSSRARAMFAVTCVLAGLSLGFVMPNHRVPKRVDGIPVTITSPGNIYDLINTIDCLAWPSEEARTNGGKNGWGGWWPAVGERGVAVSRTKHCFQPWTMVVFVKVGARWVPIGESGIALDYGSIDELPLLTRPSGP